MVIDILVLVFLLWESIEDIKSQKISLIFVLMFGVLALAVKIFMYEVSLAEMFNDVLIGMFCLCMARITGQAIGYGDGVVLIILGIFVGIRKTVITLFIAFGLMMIVAMVMLIRKGFRYNATMPFIPCIFLAYLGGVIAGCI